MEVRSNAMQSNAKQNQSMEAMGAISKAPKSGDGEGKAGKKSGKGLSCLCLEEECMRGMNSGRWMVKTV